MKRNLIPWLVILLVILALQIVNARGKTRAASAATQTAQPGQVIDFQTVMAGKTLVAGAIAAPAEKAKLEAQIDTIGKQPMQRVAAATLMGELYGPEAARSHLIALPSTEDTAAFDAVYASGTPLPAAIAARYEFFAPLAESIGKPDTDPQRAAVLASAKSTMTVLAIAAVLFVVALIGGLALLGTAIVLLALGKIRPVVDSPTPEHSSVYVQSFAIYLAAMVVVSLVLELLMYAVPALPRETRYLSPVAAATLGVGWPFVRGVRWAAMREDWGVHRGRGLLIEPLAGVGGYLAGLPIVALGILITTLLAQLGGTTVTHPIAKEIFTHPLSTLLLAVVFAPLTEETLFRGAFVSHLRGWWNPWMAGLISGIIFAAVHPQGWAAIPALGAIGFVLAMIRQWRRSLVASMTAHALNNGAIVVLLLLVGR